MFTSVVASKDLSINLTILCLMFNHIFERFGGLWENHLCIYAQDLALLLGITFII